MFILLFIFSPPAQETEASLCNAPNHEHRLFDEGERLGGLYKLLAMLVELWCRRLFVFKVVLYLCNSKPNFRALFNPKLFASVIPTPLAFRIIAIKILIIKII